MATRTDANGSSTHALTGGFGDSRKRRILVNSAKAEPYEVSATFPVESTASSQQQLYFPSQTREDSGDNNDAGNDDDDDTSGSTEESAPAAVSTSRSGKGKANKASVASSSVSAATPGLKRAVRLSKNREAARECRKKKKEYVKCLESRVAVLENQNKALMDELRLLKELYCKSMSDNKASGTTSSGYNVRIASLGGKGRQQLSPTPNFNLIDNAVSSSLTEGSLSQKLKTIRAKNSPISGLDDAVARTNASGQGLIVPVAPASGRAAALPVITGPGGARILLLQTPNTFGTPIYAVPPTSSS